MAREAANAAIAAATAAAAGLDGTSVSEDVVAASNAILAARTAIEALPEGERSAATAMLNDAVTQVAEQYARLAKEAEAARKAAEAEAEEAEAARQAAETEAEEAEAARQAAEAEANKKAAEAEAKTMAAMAKSLYNGIKAYSQQGGFDSVGTLDVFANWTAEGNIQVGDGRAGTGPGATLYEDETVTVAPLSGWTGQRFFVAADDSRNSRSGNDYEAVVYSYLGDPKPGDKFGQIGVTNAADGYEYGIDADGILVADGGGAFSFIATRVASPSFNQSAGVKSFELGTNRNYVSISGTYHGVSGEYRCEPTTGNTCAAQIAVNGFTLGGQASADNSFTVGGGTWTFKPGNLESRVMSAPKTAYASYGWWLRTSEDDEFFASSFANPRGTPTPAAAVPDTLVGTATYVGGAAGKYALSGVGTGGTNESGHFTATATLNAKFGTVNNDGTTRAHNVTGTIDGFKVGDDGAARDWSVSLGRDAAASNLLATGQVVRDRGVDQTQWTIGGRAAEKSGEWAAQMYEQGDDGVPTIATGTFYTEYENTGKMVGGFGVNKQ